MYNILSILLGLLALGFAIYSFQIKFCSTCCILSFTCCSGALISQLLEIHRRVRFSDWSALMDTMDAVIFAAVFLFMLTLLLNILAWIRRKK